MTIATVARKSSKVTSPSIPHLIIRFPTLHLALALTQLEQVIPLPPIDYSQSGILGIAATPGDRHPGHMIVLDLHQRLYGGSLADPAHLLLFRASDGLTYGLPVATLPEIQAIPADRLDPTTDASDNPGVGLTRQVIKLPTPMGEQTLFIIDADCLAQEVRQIFTDHP